MPLNQPVNPNIASTSFESKKFKYDQLALLSKEITNLQAQSPLFESSAWKKFTLEVQQSLTQQLAVLINKYNTDLNNELCDLSYKVLSGKTYFDSATLKELTNTLQQYTQYIQLYKDSALPNNELYQDRIQTIDSKRSVIHIQFNSLVSQSAIHWVEDLKSKMAGQSISSLSKENLDLLQQAIVDLKHYHQAYTQIENVFYKQQTADHIQEQIESIEELMPKQSISLGNPLGGISSLINTARGLSFFNVPQQLLTRQNSFPPIPGP